MVKCVEVRTEPNVGILVHWSWLEQVDKMLHWQHYTKHQRIPLINRAQGSGIRRKPHSSHTGWSVATRLVCHVWLLLVLTMAVVEAYKSCARSHLKGNTDVTLRHQQTSVMLSNLLTLNNEELCLNWLRQKLDNNLSESMASSQFTQWLTHAWGCTHIQYTAFPLTHKWIYGAWCAATLCFICTLGKQMNRPHSDKISLSAVCLWSGCSCVYGLQTSFTPLGC